MPSNQLVRGIVRDLRTDSRVSGFGGHAIGEGGVTTTFVGSFRIGQQFIAYEEASTLPIRDGDEVMVAGKMTSAGVLNGLALRNVSNGAWCGDPPSLALVIAHIVLIAITGSIALLSVGAVFVLGLSVFTLLAALVCGLLAFYGCTSLHDIARRRSARRLLEASLPRS